MSEAEKQKLSKRERLLKQKEELEAELRKVSAKERTEQKARDDAMCFAIGRAVRAEMAESTGFTKEIKVVLERRLTSPKERALFDLKPLDAEKAAPKKPDGPPKLAVDNDATEAA